MKQFYQIHENDFEVVCHDHEISFPQHMHNELEILYMSKGKQKIMIDGETSVMEQGSCALIFPNIRHEYFRTGEEGKNGRKSVMIFMPPHMLLNLFPSASESAPKSGILLPQLISENAFLAFEKIAAETVPAARVGWAQVILAHTVPLLEISSGGKGADTAEISKLMNYISANFRRSISLEILSDELGMSKSRISHIFSDKIHISLRSYLGIRRSEYAAQLIKTSDETLANISALSGFESLRTFNRVFREVYGVTPSRFRQNIRKYIEQNH